MTTFLNLDSAIFFDESLLNIVQQAIDEFEIDGAIASYSTWKTFDEDETMTDERAKTILSTIPSGQFLMKIKFIREQNKSTPDIEYEANGNWVIEDKFDPIKNKLNKIVTISKTTKPGLLIGVEGPYYKNAYPVTAVVYGLYPVRTPDPDNLQPLKVGKLNCVAQRVMEFYSTSTRGFGLTDARF